jgi:hypothetical protein
MGREERERRKKQEGKWGTAAYLVATTRTTLSHHQK